MRRVLLLLPLLLAGLMLPSDVSGQNEDKKNDTKNDSKNDTKKAKKDNKEQKKPSKPSFATDPATLKVAKGFKIERLYSVPQEKYGSWVNLCVDPKGRLITSDQYGPLYRITVPPLGSTDEPKIEQLPADVGDAQGMLWAFDALYVMSNSNRQLPSGTKLKPALYRVTSSKNDDTLDKVELLLEFQGGGGEHGTHAILPHPDGKRLTLVCGNQTKMPKFDTTRVPPIWGEDHLLPRMPDGRGFMRGVNGPGGFMLNVDPNGKNVELFSVGFRNQYDAAYNRDGELFSYDADMEWDMNTPWYRPTRVCLVPSGSEFGWRNGAGKYPAYYADSLPGICNIGPGSPTGVCFGYGAKFPAKYQEAYFICDWSYGKLYAVHLEREGSGYKGVAEEFVAGSPLPLTDVVIHPDGAMYFAIGGRRTQSGLYRVTYTGSESTDPVPPRAVKRPNPRHDLEALHAPKSTNAVEQAWSSLASADRFVRVAARVAIEHQDWKTWRDRALTEKNPQARITAILALARSAATCPEHDKDHKGKGDAELRGAILKSLGELNFAKLTLEQQLELTRVYHILFNRFGRPTDAETKAWATKFEPAFPTKNRYLDSELLQVFVYLEHPKAVEWGMKLLAAAPTQEEQIEYARGLRTLRSGWTPELRKQYAEWLVSANNFRGGNSLTGFMKWIRDDFTRTMASDDLKGIESLLVKAADGPKGPPQGPPRAFVKKWTLDDLADKLTTGLAKGRDFEKGKKLFADARCYSCHRFGDDGSAYGPDLSGIAGRFSPKDLLTSILDPNKEISDQYAAVEIELEDGGLVVGRIVNLSGEGFMVNTDMLDPNAMKNVNRNNIAKMKPSKTSMMPAGLLDTLTEGEALDLMAFLLSRGDRTNAMFAK
jgi:putative heme-binding domain-containing protein